MPRFALFDVDNLRKSSTVADFPWSETSITLIRVDAKGVVRQAKSLTEKHSLLAVASDKDLVLATGPEVFAVDDIPAARAALRASVARAALPVRV